MYHISCFGHTTVVLNCGNVIRFSIMGFCFNLPQEGKSHAIRLLLQVEVRLDKNIVPLSYKVRAQTQIGRQPGRFPPSLPPSVECSLVQQCPLEDALSVCELPGADPGVFTG